MNTLKAQLTMVKDDAQGEKPAAPLTQKPEEQDKPAAKPRERLSLWSK